KTRGDSYIQFFISSGLRFSAWLSILITCSDGVLHVLYSAQILSRMMGRFGSLLKPWHVE
ncbi:hypothetical protein LZ626_20680, partial [Aeromonas allosaccharophila]|uniref:hypothetical protein n=1 Tax=Aeromonas allosaccharophila TaxID=656 RepID=UPI001F15FE54